MTNDEIDLRLSTLLVDRDPPVRDPSFVDRVVALAAFDQALKRHRRKAIARVGSETLGLVAVIGSFAWLARTVPDGAAGFGDAVAIGSPAMLGLLMLVAWGVAMRGSSATG